VCISKPHAFFGQGIDHGGFDFGFPIVATQITIAQVVGQNVNDIWFR
jgi:hypothetical protein